MESFLSAVIFDSCDICCGSLQVRSQTFLNAGFTLPPDCEARAKEPGERCKLPNEVYRGLGAL